MIEDAGSGNGNVIIDIENSQNLITDEVCSSRDRVLKDEAEVPDVIFACIFWKVVMSLTHTVVLNDAFVVLVPHLGRNVE